MAPTVLDSRVCLELYRVLAVIDGILSSPRTASSRIAEESMLNLAGSCMQQSMFWTKLLGFSRLKLQHCSLDTTQGYSAWGVLSKQNTRIPVKYPCIHKSLGIRGN